jgi:alkylation response protein AidB-like acyl-CoA dehydrogenase
MKRTLFEPDHEAFRDSVREFVARCIVPHEEKLIEQRFVDREIWLEAGRNGYLGLAVPERFGGSDANDYRFNAVLGEELARSSAAVASALGIQYDIVAPYLVKLTTDEQKERWLPRFCAGELITAIALTEPSG